VTIVTLPRSVYRVQDCSNQVSARPCLRNKRRSAKTQRTQLRGGHHQAGKQHNRCSTCGLQRRDEGDTVFTAQVGIEDNDMGLTFVRKPQCFTPTSRLTRDPDMHRIALE